MRPGCQKWATEFLFGFLAHFGPRSRRADWRTVAETVLKGFRMLRTNALALLMMTLSLVAGCGPKDKGAAPEVKGKTGSATQALLPEEADKLKRAVTEGDELWNAAVEGVKEMQVGAKKKYDEAFEKYMVVVNAPQPLPDKAVMARVYGRVIDVAASRKNNKALAKEVAIKSLRQEILPVCNTPESSPVLQAARSALKAEDKELDDWLDNQENKGGGTKGGGTKGGKAAVTADDLKKLGYDEIVRRLGEPDEEYRSKKKSNMRLAIWETGDSLYTVVSLIEAIDGSGQTLVLTVHDKRSKSIVENMKRTIDNPK
jgi:hypothetical protein